MNLIQSLLPAVAVILACVSSTAQETTAGLENRALRAELAVSNGAVTLLDKQTGVRWELGPPETTLKGSSTAVSPPLNVVEHAKNVLRYRREGIGEFSLRLLANPPGLEYSVVPEEDRKDLRLLSKALPLGPGEDNYYAAAYRMGIMLHAEGDKPFSRRFRDGCSMSMFGAVKGGSALLVT